MPEILKLESDRVLVRELLRDKRIAWSAVGISTAMMLAWPFATIGLELSKPLAGGLCLAPVAGLIAAVMSLATLHGDPVAGGARKGVPGRIEVDADGVTVAIGGAVRRFARADVAGGWIETRGAESSAVLRMRTGAVVAIVVRDAAAANEVLRAAGVAPEERAVAIPLGSSEPPGARRMLAALAMMVVGLTLSFVLADLGLIWSLSAHALGLALAMVIPIALGLVALQLLARPLITTTLVIGTDGVTVVRLGRRKFVSFAATRRVRAVDRAIELHQRAGKVVQVAAATADEAAAVASRIQDGLEAGERSAVHANLERLDRRGRSLGEWRNALVALAREGKGYRELGFGPRELLEVVEDARAPRERRIAAAAALSAAGDAEVGRRIRVAVDACADDLLRVAIDKASAGELEDASVAEALSAAEKERAGNRRPVG